MKYEKESVKQWVEEIYNAASQSTTLSYIIPYYKINSFVPSNKDCHADIREYLFEEDNYMADEIQNIDFDNTNQHIVVMWYIPPREEKFEEVMEMKKYTIDNYKEFCNNAFITPPIEKFEDGSINEKEWLNTHQIHITVGDCSIDLDYNADNTDELELALKKMYEMEIDYRSATTGNTAGSQYRPAEFKDIVRYYIMEQYESEGGLNWFEYARMAEVNLCNMSILRDVYQRISNIGVSLYKEMGCDFSRFDPFSLCAATKEGIRNIVKNWVGSDVEMSYDPQTDKTFLIDYTFSETGDFIGWSWGTMIEEDIAHQLECYRTLIFEEEE